MQEVTAIGKCNGFEIVGGRSELVALGFAQGVDRELIESCTVCCTGSCTGCFTWSCTCPTQKPDAVLGEAASGVHQERLLTGKDPDWKGRPMQERCTFKQNSLKQLF